MEYFGAAMFTRNVLQLDEAAETERIAGSVREHVLGTLRRRGVVVGMSGGIDSSVVASLCVRALGRDRVLGLLMPERDSSDDALALGRAARRAPRHRATSSRTSRPTLEAAGCYARQDEAIRMVFPEYGAGLEVQDRAAGDAGLRPAEHLSLTVRTPGRRARRARMPPAAYLQIVAATNFKQRARKMIEYYHADRLNYAVAGTPNRLEYDQGFFVKHGDGAADFKPIAHLYKTQVYALAAHLGVPRGDPHAARRRPTPTRCRRRRRSSTSRCPTTRWTSASRRYNHGDAGGRGGAALGLTAEQVERVYRDIEASAAPRRYLHSTADPGGRGGGASERAGAPGAGRLGRAALGLCGGTAMNVQRRVKDFVVTNFYVSNPEELNDTDPLVDRGIIDSTGMLEVIPFLETEFGIRIQDDEMLPENLGSIDRIAAFVVRKRASGVAAHVG